MMSAKAWVMNCNKPQFITRSNKISRVYLEFLRVLEADDAYSDLYDFFTTSELFYIIRYDIVDFDCPVCGVRLDISHFKRQAPFCSMKCYKTSEDAREKISEIKTALYANAEWKAKTEDKKKKTNIERFGVEHVMQNSSIFAKHEKSSYQSYSYRGIVSHPLS